MIKFQKKQIRGAILETAKKRAVYYDVMRIVAIFLVLLTHTPAYTLYFFNTGLKQWTCLFASVTIKICVPLFFMISGALLLGKDEKWGTILKKRVSRFAITIVLFELLYVLVKYLVTLSRGSEFNYTFLDLLGGIFAGDIIGLESYWYMYAHLGILLSLPFLRAVAKNMKKSDFIALTLFHFIIWTLIPAVLLLLPDHNIEGTLIHKDFTIPLAAVKSMYFPLAGFWLDRNVNVEKIRRKEIALICVIYISAVLVSSLFAILEQKYTGACTLFYVEMFAYFTTGCAFLLIKYYYSGTRAKLSAGLSRAVCAVGALSFSMYIFEPFCKLFFEETYFNYVSPRFPMILNSVVWCFFCMIAGGTVGALLKKVPVVRSLL